MHLLIAHPIAVFGDRLQKRVGEATPLNASKAVYDLSAMFDYAEHHEPDVAIVAASMAQAEEFEVLKLLCDRLGIGCVLVDDTPDGVTHDRICKSARDLKILSAEFSREALNDALTASRATLVSQPALPTSIECAADFDPKHVILIGSSTGGVDALLTLLQSFPENCPPTLIVQHTGGCFKSSLVRLLDKDCLPHVKEAENGEVVRPGHVFIAPGNEAHLGLGAREGKLLCRLREAPPFSGHRPSVDYLFESALPIAKFASAAILTGMGRDGADGLKKLRDGGASTFGQDEATSVVYGMPRVAYEMGAVERQLPIAQIGNALLNSCRKKGDNHATYR